MCRLSREIPLASRFGLKERKIWIFPWAVLTMHVLIQVSLIFIVQQFS